MVLQQYFYDSYIIDINDEPELVISNYEMLHKYIELLINKNIPDSYYDKPERLDPDILRKLIRFLVTKEEGINYYLREPDLYIAIGKLTIYSIRDRPLYYVASLE